jgi:YHS domain-containing protein
MPSSSLPDVQHFPTRTLLSAFLVGVALLGSCSSPPRVVNHDVVCGAIVSRRRAIQYVYKNVVYYFDSAECLEEFKEDPTRYASR